MSSHPERDVLATIAAWRDSGDDRRNPVRFALIAAVARRAAGHGGEVRRHLDEKLARLVDAYAADIARAESGAVDVGGIALTDAPPIPRPLAELVAYIGDPAPPGSHAATQGDALARAPSYPDLPVIDYFRETWAKVSAKRQVRQSQEHVPENAGPLNSNNLVHRSLSVMQDLSPGYLRQFLSYVDALSWMEQLNGIGAASPREGARAGNARKIARGKPR